MNDLNDVVKRILIKNGFSDVIPLHEREYQLRTIETLLILLWMILSVFLIRSLSLALTWFLLVIICLTVEQLINVSSLWLSHRRKRERIRFQNSPAFRQSLNRPIYQRINIAFCILF